MTILRTLPGRYRRVLLAVLAVALAGLAPISSAHAAAARDLGTTAGPRGAKATVSGTVFDPDGTTADPGRLFVGLQHVGEPNVENYDADVADDGTFTVTKVPPGAYVLRVIDYYRPDVTTTWYGGTYRAAGATVIHVTSDQQVTGIDVTLHTAAHIDGTVSAQDGSAVDEQVPQILDVQTGDGSWHALKKGQYVPVQDEDNPGSFDLGGLPPGTYRLYTYNDGQSGAGYWWPDTPDRGQATDIVLTEGARFEADGQELQAGTISGTVTAVGRAQPTTLQVYRHDSDGWNLLPWDSYSDEADEPFLRQNDDGSGTYTARALPEGTYRILFSGSSYYDDAYRHEAVPEWYGGAHDLADATDIVLGAGDQVRGKGLVMIAENHLVRRPHLTGRPVVGHTLRADRGAWQSGHITKTVVRWYVGTHRLQHHGATLTLTTSMIGKHVHAHVVVHEPGWAVASADSSNTGAVRRR